MRIRHRTGCINSQLTFRRAISRRVERYNHGCSIRFCSMSRTQRIRDPVHDLIVFEERDDLDQTAWELLGTPEFQRLRGIKQLGVSEFVYPGATHSRFAHSIGVFFNARRLLKLIRREIAAGRVEGEFDEARANIAVLAALLHDVGHGPFSHAFETARKAVAEGRGIKGPLKKHEAWSASIIENEDGNIFNILNRVPGRAKAIADLLLAETPTDMYHAIVSSSFDADRLDYIQRDRYMSGIGLGVIDLTWLLDNVRVASIDVTAPSNDAAVPVYTHSFCLGYKGREAAEDFLLARYRLYTNVYLHKTTRGMEQLLTALFRAVAEEVGKENYDALGMGMENPLAKFLSPKGETLPNYLQLDDAVVWGAIDALSRCKVPRISELALRLRTRQRPLALDIQTEFPESSENQRRARHRIEQQFRSKIGVSVFRDEARLTIYGTIGADDEKAQKRLMIQLRHKDLKEITEFKDTAIAANNLDRTFLRYYFLDESDFNAATDAMKDVGKGHR